MQYSVTVAGLSGPATASHLHGPNGPPGVNAAPMIFFNDLISATSVQGTVNVTTDNMNAMLAGTTYFVVSLLRLTTGQLRPYEVHIVETCTCDLKFDLFLLC